MIAIECERGSVHTEHGTVHRVRQTVEARAQKVAEALAFQAIW